MNDENLNNFINEFKKCTAIKQRATLNILSDSYKIKKSDLKKVIKAKEVYEFIKPLIAYKEQEHLLVLLINKDSKIFGKKIITIGTNDLTLISNKDILKYALLNNATAIIISHNHPSDNSLASFEDKRATRSLESACKVIDVTLLDHIITCISGYYSFKEDGLL